MNDIVTNLNALAVSVFRQKDTAKQPYDSFYMDDGVLREMQRLSFFPTNFRDEVAEAIPNILTEPEFSSVLATEGSLTPMVLTADGGSRMSAVDVLSGLLSSAAVLIYLLRLPSDEATFVHTVLDNFEELRRAARGDMVRVYSATGVAGVSLSEGKQATTPWGVLRPVHQVRDNHAFMFHLPRTTCSLIEQRRISVRFDLAPMPEHNFDPKERRSPRARLLFPLACILSSNDTENPVGTIETWSTLLLPFQTGFGYSVSMLAHRMQKIISLDDAIDTLEELSKTIEAVHSSNIDIAATRLVSSVGHRTDHTDALIDAVMVWENLLGTSGEVMFRVTAALAKMLEPVPSKRRELRKTLTGIYGIRSRIIHGAAVNSSTVREASKTAVDVAIKTLREFYRRGSDWMALKSSERADILLLEE